MCAITHNLVKAMRVRKVVTRSGVNIRGKFPSRKLNKPVHWECLPERDAILMFEMHPLVLSYQEQPLKETYYDEAGMPHQCYPDFLLRLVGGSELIVEVKRTVDLNRPSVKRKLGQIALRFSELGRPYRVITEGDIRREPLHSNLKRLWKSVRSIRIGRETLDVIDALSSRRSYTVRELAESLRSEQDVYALIGQGYLRTNLETELTANSKVWTATNEEAGDGAFSI